MRTPKPEGEGPDPAPRDQMLVAGLSEDGRRAAVLRAREGRLEAGLLQPAKDGKPLTGELVKLSQRPEFPLLYDVESLAASPFPTERREGRAGPAQVATARFREGWDGIWGAGGGDDELLN